MSHFSMNLFLSGGPSLIFTSRVFPHADLPQSFPRPSNARGELSLMIGKIIGTAMDPPCGDGFISLTSIGPFPSEERALEIGSASLKRKILPYLSKSDLVTRPVAAYAASCAGMDISVNRWLELVDGLRQVGPKAHPIVAAAMDSEALLEFEVLPLNTCTAMDQYHPIRARVGSLTYDGDGPEMKGLACLYTLVHFPQIVKRDVTEFMARSEEDLLQSEEGQALLDHLDHEFEECLSMRYILPSKEEKE